MSDKSSDRGVITALIQRFENQRLPQALEIKKRVDKGEVLNEKDMEFLNEVFEDSQHIQPLIQKNPEYKSLVARVVSLYKEIMDKALANEQGRSG